MQPYLFAYLGYYQLMACADVFVVYDDVNFIKGGWINRNRILLNREPHTFTLPISSQSQHKLINEIELSADETAKAVQKIELTLRHAYGKAAHFGEVFPVIEGILNAPVTGGLSGLIWHSLSVLAGRLKLGTRLMLSSEIGKDSSLKGQHKLIAICRALGADEYVNAIGGMGLYDARAFEDSGIHLSFIKMRDIHYEQFGGQFVPNLSIIDPLMFMGFDAVSKMLAQYDLMEAAA